MEEWLSEEEQYKDSITRKEISRIKDVELRELREKHRLYREKIFFNEKQISDQEFTKLYQKDCEEEKRELEEYRKRKASE